MQISKTGLVIISIAIIIFLSITSISAVEINQTESGDVLCNSEDKQTLNENMNDFSTLSNEINSTSNNSFILTKDYSYNPKKDSNLTKGIIINKDNFIINGNGHSIDGKNSSKIFFITSTNVTLKNINIYNGYSNTDGGSVYFSGQDSKIINSSFKNCTTTKYGGAVSFKQTGTIIDSTFENNKAGTGGAADFGKNGNVINSMFKNNYAKFQGGALSFYGISGVENSTFIHNTGGDGGTIYSESESRINASTFIENYAIGYGGGIYFMTNGIVTNSKFIQNSAFLEGGAIIIKSGNLNISDTEFDYNMAKNGNSIYISSTWTKLENLTFINENIQFESEISIEKGKISKENLSFNNKTKTNPIESNKQTANTKKTTSKTVKVIKKKTAITSKSMTFKSWKKNKKYTIILKSGKKVLKGKKIKLTIRGKTYTKKTNNNGKVIFKIKISKKGKYKVKIRFNGDKLYKSSKKTATIKIK